MLDEIKFSVSAAVVVGLAFFIVPVALTAGINVAQRIGFVECLAPQVQK